MIPPLTGTSFSGWSIAEHPLGRGHVRAANVTMAGDSAALSLSAGAYNGAEILTAARHGPGIHEARMRTPPAPGSLSAFFLYEGVEDGNDEIDIELFNDGSRRVMFTTWVAGEQTNTETRTLPFDPSAGFHLYTIEWSIDLARFHVDGVKMMEFRRGIPRNPMFVMANAWWPVWIDGPLLISPRALEIESIHAVG
ncbi:MAG TPA: family 16 glycosylhydrolase [Longimicrobium sp.]|nr:family 16 glycosylhydrolase [Longimicrobium sp.]